MSEKASYGYYMDDISNAMKAQLTALVKKKLGWKHQGFECQHIYIYI